MYLSFRLTLQQVVSIPCHHRHHYHHQRQLRLRSLPRPLALEFGVPHRPILHRQNSDRSRSWTQSQIQNRDFLRRFHRLQMLLRPPLDRIRTISEYLSTEDFSRETSTSSTESDPDRYE